MPAATCCAKWARRCARARRHRTWIGWSTPCATMSPRWKRCGRIRSSRRSRSMMRGGSSLCALPWTRCSRIAATSQIASTNSPAGNRHRPHRSVPSAIDPAAGEGDRSVMAPHQTKEPLALSEITSYHAHIYYDLGEERGRAERLRTLIGERFVARIGAWHDELVGPHLKAMYQVAFAVDLFPRFVPWLMLNRMGLSILVHPNTRWPHADHLTHALWLG